MKKIQTRYVLETVLEHLPLVTGSERNMAVHIAPSFFYRLFIRPGPSMPLLPVGCNKVQKIKRPTGTKKRPTTNW